MSATVSIPILRRSENRQTRVVKKLKRAFRELKYEPSDHSESENWAEIALQVRPGWSKLIKNLAWAQQRPR
jgi:hypothetical protein